jgi:DNA-binding beta-propeller fold protein YncE
MNLQFARHSFKRTFHSAIQLTCLLGLACIMLILPDDAMAASKKSKKDKKEEVKEYVWPAPPSDPVIKFVREFNSKKVFETKKKSSWKDKLLGKEDEASISMTKPYGVHADKNGRVLVADTFLPGLAVFDFKKQQYSIIDSTGEGKLNQPINVATDSLGRTYIADARGQKVAVYDLNDSFLTTLQFPEGFGRPVGLAVDNQRERVYVADILRHHIAVFDFDGKHISTIGKRGGEPGEFNFPLNIALDKDGWLYVIDSMNFRVQIFEPESEAVIVFGEQGTGLGQFVRPKGIAVDSDGNIYVTDAAFNNVQLFNKEGKLLMYFGAQGSGPGEFNLVAGISIDAQDMIYIADQANKRIQVFQYLGQPDIEDTKDQVQTQ